MSPAKIKKQRSKEVQLVKEVVAERRRASIHSREAQRIATQCAQAERKAKEQQLVSTKYPKQDILQLKQIFDRYDIDGSGSIDSSELKLALQKQKDMNLRYTGKPKTLEERQAERGGFLVDFSDSLFRALDADADGCIEFEELLRLLHPYATGEEMHTMLSWVDDAIPEQTVEEFELNDEQRQEIHAMFSLYDRGRSGGISVSEFRHAMRRCGLEGDEIDELFAEADTDDNRSISKEEFTVFMRKVMFNSGQLTPSMLYSSAW